MMEMADVHVQHKHNGNNSPYRDCIAPIRDDQIARDNLKRDLGYLGHEEVVSGGDAKCLVDKSACETDSGRGEGKEGDHLCDC